VRVRIYVEGGGDSKELQARCREGFRKLLINSGFKDRMPGFRACGGRNKTFDMFQTSLIDGSREYSLLLVDSEDPVIDQDLSPDSSIAWNHLFQRDAWIKPRNASNNQAQLMATCMESWIMADHQAIISFFGQRTLRNSLLPLLNLESRHRKEVQATLEHATSDCGRGREYKKGKRSFQLLGRLDPYILKANLGHFNRLITTLEQILR